MHKFFSVRLAAVSNKLESVLKGGGVLVLLSLLVGCQLMPSSNGGEDRSLEKWRMMEAEAEDALNNSTNLANSFAAVGYDAVLRQGGKIKYQHNRSLPVMALDDYRSFVKGVRLEGNGKISSVVVRSFPIKAGFVDNDVKSILYPSFLLLNEQYQVLEDVVRPKVNLSRSLLGKYGMSTSYTVPATAKQAKYLVIYVAAYNRMGTYHYCENGTGVVRFRSSSLPEYKGVDCHALPLSLEGTIELELE